MVGSDYGLTAAAAIGEEAVGDDMLMACAIGEVASGTLLLVSMASSNAPARRPARTLLRCRHRPTHRHSHAAATVVGANDSPSGQRPTRRWPS